MQVAVVEAIRIASGVTGNTTAKITALQEPFYSKLASQVSPEAASAYARAQTEGLNRIAALVAELGIDCGFERRPAFTYAMTEKGAGTLREEAGAARAAGLQVEETTDTGLPFDVTLALRLDNQAQFNARSYCKALAREIASKGGTIVEGVRAMDVKERNGECVVETDHESVNARHVVVATHVPFTFRGLFFAKTRPIHSYAVAARLDDEPPGGMYLSADEPLRSVRDYSQNEKRWLIVGGESHKTGQDDDTETNYQALREWGAEKFGIDSYEFAWSAHDPASGDGMPLIGTLTPTTNRIWVATGFRKWGMANATTGAEILTTGITGRDHPLADVFSPRRNLVSTLRRVAGEVVDTVKRGITDRVSDDDEPQPGEGAVLGRGRDRVAVYLSEDGKTRVEVSAICTHLGCVVAWNNGDKTWDCPCHGSRFAVDGSVIEGPATEPLASKTQKRSA
jgi:glycine/D-amino acid oxidase-like deaminating enzyme/nitrite reductase/ring-hydroxylating ferredoxin subunit